LTDRSGKAIAGLLFLIMLAGGSSVVTDSSNDTNTDDGDGDLGDGGGDGGFEDPSQPECSDGIDNDGDGLIDEEDPNCDPNDPNFNEMEG